MQWLLNLSTRSKLILGISLVLACLAGVLVIGYSGITALRESERKLFEREFQNAVDLKDIRSNQNAVRAALYAMMLPQQPVEPVAMHDSIRARTSENASTFRELIERNRGDAALVSRLEELRRIETVFVQTIENDIVPLITAGRIAEAEALAFGIQDQRNVQMRNITNQLVEQAERNAEAAVTQATEQANQTLRVFAMLGLLALLLGIGKTLVMNKVIAGPLKAVARAAEDVANGDLTASVPGDHREDEVGNLASTFRLMVSKLRSVNRDLQEGVTVLSSSASEILAMTTQVATTATETATAVAQTTTTVEEVRQTTQLASQKASSMSEAAQRSLDVSQRGAAAVLEANEGMRRVQQQMESLAASVLQLSEQSQSIGDIITTVSGLAEQSNLLAVNAAIEAAKAGEAGRGFAVVAAEVKALAEQSRQATSQVRAILGDIQRATGAAVLATEQASKAAEAGVRQASDAGEAIQILAATIAEGAQAATQIAAICQQQTAGMEQIAIAMENINQASAQNVASTRQSESTAQGLHDLGGKLQELVEQYKV